MEEIAVRERGARDEPADAGRPRETAELLESTSLFTGLPRARLDALARHARAQALRERSIVVHEGAECTTLYVVVAGRVRLFASEGEREVTLGLRRAGDYVGEIAPPDGGRHPVSAMTLTRTELIALPMRCVLATLDESPELVCNVVRELASRTLVLVENLKTFALKDVYGRLVVTLYRLAEEEDDRMVVRERVTQQALADMVGASRAMVGRILKDLATGGYVSNDGGRLVIEKRLPERW